MDLWDIIVEQLHGSFIAEEAASIGRKRPHHDRKPASVQPLETFLLHQLFEHVNDAGILSLWSSLEPALQHILRNGDRPVENSCHASGEECSQDTDLTAITSLWSHCSLEYFVTTEIGCTGRDVPKEGGQSSFVNAAYSALGPKTLDHVDGAVVLWWPRGGLLDLKKNNIFCDKRLNVPRYGAKGGGLSCNF